MKDAQGVKQVWSEPRLTEIEVRMTEKNGTIWDNMGHHTQSES